MGPQRVHLAPRSRSPPAAGPASPSRTRPRTPPACPRAGPDQPQERLGPVHRVLVQPHRPVLGDYRHLGPLAVHIDADVDRLPGLLSRAWNLSPGASCYRAELGRGPALIGSDEHVQTSGPRTWRPPLPRPAEGPDAAGAARRVARAGRAAIRRQHLPSRRAREVSVLVWRAHIPDTYAASGPGSATWKDPDPRRRSSRGSGGSEQARLPGDGGYATP